jgi:AraC-like DNA-binding protein
MIEKQFLLDGNYKLLLQTLGVSLPEFLKQAKLPDDLFDVPKPMVTTNEYYRMWDALTTYGDEMLLPLQAGLAFQPEMFSPVLIVALSSNNGKMALERIIKYKRLVAPMIFTLATNKTYGDLIIQSDQKNGQLPLGLTAFEMVFMNRILCLGTKENIHPVAVQCTKEIQSQLYADYFGVKPLVGDINVIRFHKHDLEREFLTSNQAVWDFYLNGLDEQLKSLQKTTSFASIVKRSLASMLPTGEVTMESLANKIGFSKRTIQRKLALENTTFQEQLTIVREEFAKKYIKETEASTKEIAFLLGYSETNSFVRAFKSWTGRTISNYRGANQD